MIRRLLLHRDLGSVKLLLILLAIDLAFIVLHILLKIDVIEHSGFRINRDGGFGEIYQYTKAALSGMVLLVLAKRERSGLLLLWSCLCFYLFIDDWLQLHERVGGKMFGIYLESTFADSYRQGQLIYAALVTLTAGLASIHFWRLATPTVHRLSLGLLASFGLLGLSAVVIDYTHNMWLPESLDLLAVILEEGGEHVAISLLLWFSIRGLSPTLHPLFGHAAGPDCR